MSRFCTECGQANDDEKFCTSCGAPLASRQQPEVVDPGILVAPKPPRRKVSPWLVVALVALVGAAAGVGLATIKSTNSGSDATPATTGSSSSTGGAGVPQSQAAPSTAHPDCQSVESGSESVGGSVGEWRLVCHTRDSISDTFATNIAGTVSGPGPYQGVLGSQDRYYYFQCVWQEQVTVLRCGYPDDGATDIQRGGVVWLVR